MYAVVLVMAVVQLSVLLCCIVNSFKIIKSKTLSFLTLKILRSNSSSTARKMRDAGRTVSEFVVRELRPG